MANSSPVYDWFQERLEIQDIAADVTSKSVPPHVNIFYCLGGITLVMYTIPGMLAVTWAFVINYFSRFFKYSSTLCIPGGYLILVLYTKNVNSQMIGMGIIYSMVFLKSNSSVFKEKLKSLS